MPDRTRMLLVELPRELAERARAAKTGAEQRRAEGEILSAIGTALSQSEHQGDEMEGVPGLKQARDVFEVTYFGNGKSWQDALSYALAVAEPAILAAQPPAPVLGDEERERLEVALEPFAIFAKNNTNEDGWTEGACRSDRIVDWFGPKEFRAARNALRTEDGEICKRCGRPVAATCPTWWTAPDDLWNEVEGGPAGIRCIPCFARDCEEADVWISWRAVREPQPPAGEGESLPAELSWCRVHHTASTERGCKRCLEETGGYTTTVYVPAESATEIARLQGDVERLREEVLKWMGKEIGAHDALKRVEAEWVRDLMALGDRVEEMRDACKRGRPERHRCDEIVALLRERQKEVTKRVAAGHQTEGEKLSDLTAWAESMVDSYSVAPPSVANQERRRQFVNLAAAARAMAPSDSQGDQERCGGSGLVAYFTADNLRREKRCPGCPDCNPVPARSTTAEQRQAAIHKAAELVQKGESGFVRRERSAPTQVEGDDGCTCSQFLLPDDCPVHGKDAAQPQTGDESNWLIGPGDDGACVLDGPAVEQNVAVVPEHRLAAAEEVLGRISRGSEIDSGEPVKRGEEADYIECCKAWRARNAEAVSLARAYFEDRTIAMVQTPEQSEGGDEEDWPELTLTRLRPGRMPYISSDVEFSEANDQETRRYVPATSQDSSDLARLNRELAAELAGTRDRATKAEAERDACADEASRLALMEQETARRAERAETALKELAEEFDRQAERDEAEVEAPGGCEGDAWSKKANERAASLAREKTAKLKEGER